MSERVEQRLKTIQAAILLIEKRMAAISCAEDFVRTDTGILVMDAISMRLQVIGENVKKIHEACPDYFPSRDIDPNPIIRFRDFISHHYDAADYELVFDICTHHLPRLKQKLFG